MKSKAYHYVRFRWWRRADVKKAVEDLEKKFIVEKIVSSSKEGELLAHKDTREEFKVKADTLLVMLSPMRAVLSQKEAAPFTKKDVELRKKLLELYPRSRPTPFPWQFISEPEYEVE